jgi:hypothetical protein
MNLIVKRLILDHILASGISCNVYWPTGHKECYPNSKDYDDFGIEKKVFMLQRNEQECVPGLCALVIFQKRFSISTEPGMFL